MSDISHAEALAALDRLAHHGRVPIWVGNTITAIVRAADAVPPQGEVVELTVAEVEEIRQREQAIIDGNWRLLLDGPPAASGDQDRPA